MFDRIIIRPQAALDTVRPLDLGVVAEAMLFYGRVEVVLQAQILQQLLVSCGPDTLIELAESEFLQFIFQENGTGIRADASTGRERFSPVSFRVKTAQGVPVGLDRFGPQMFVDATGKTGRGKRLFRRFERLLTVKTVPEQIIDATKADFEDVAYVEESVCDLLQYYAPEFTLPHSSRFRLVPAGGGWFTVDSNINFDAANLSYHRHVPAE
ncbi:MAG TPA: hypothetical protein VMH39_01870, partial [Gemmatimonadaceae bacterium]|nr:hypothetical protein [Gemmatimonadaceae bacterium]